MKDSIVLDKCYLQGSKAVDIRELANSHRLLVSDALFYELLSDGEPARSRCFAKFPPVDNPVDLVSHIGTLMRVEIDTLKKSEKPSIYKEALRFQFNAKLVTQDYLLPKEALAAVDDKTNDLRANVDMFLDIATTARSLFPGLAEGDSSDIKIGQDVAEKLIAQPRSLLTFYSSLKAPPGEKALPPEDIIGDDWAIDVTPKLSST